MENTGIIASYNITSDKLHFHAGAERLPADQYQAAKAARFAWWPGSKQFVAKWSVEAEDFILSLGAEIEENDTPDNVEGRVERFTGYAERKENAADRSAEYLLERANTARRQRLAASSVKNNLEAAQHWQDRIAGAIAHAAFKERPDVIARRIKGLEKDLRGWNTTLSNCDIRINWWTAPDKELTRDRAQRIAGIDRSRTDEMTQFGFYKTVYDALKSEDFTPEMAREVALKYHAARKAEAQRWCDHLNKRLDYEQAFLKAAGGIIADSKPLEVGGAVKGSWQNNGNWCIIAKVHKNTVEALYKNSGYTPESGYKERGEWVSGWKIEKTKITGVMTAAEVAELETPLYGSECVKPPKKSKPKKQASDGLPENAEEIAPAIATVAERNQADRAAQIERLQPAYVTATAKAEAIRTAQKEATATSARIQKRTELQSYKIPGFFPTPAPVVERVIDAAEIEAEHLVLEPSAGDGALVFGAVDAGAKLVVALEINHSVYNSLLDNMRSRSLSQPVGPKCVDFFEWDNDMQAKEEQPTFDRVIMNPPFENLADIDHVRTAFNYLKDGGRLVAIMGEGPFFRSDKKACEFRSWLDELGGTSEKLPEDSFKQSNTGVNTRLVVIDKETPSQPASDFADSQLIFHGAQLAMF